MPQWCGLRYTARMHSFVNAVEPFWRANQSVMGRAWEVKALHVWHCRTRIRCKFVSATSLVKHSQIIASTYKYTLFGAESRKIGACGINTHH